MSEEKRQKCYDFFKRLLPFWFRLRVVVTKKVKSRNEIAILEQLYEFSLYIDACRDGSV